MLGEYGGLLEFAAFFLTTSSCLRRVFPKDLKFGGFYVFWKIICLNNNGYLLIEIVGCCRCF